MVIMIQALETKCPNFNEFQNRINMQKRIHGGQGEAVPPRPVKAAIATTPLELSSITSKI